MMKDMTAIVAAANPNRGIGYQGQMPWKLPGDMEHFKKVTIGSFSADTVNNDSNNKKNVVIMGRKTWESIPSQYRPLCHRINVIITRQTNYNVNCTSNNNNNDIIVASSFEDATMKLQTTYNNNSSDDTTTKCMMGDIFVMGGAEIYQYAINNGYVSSIVYTEIDEILSNSSSTAPIKYDAHFPELLSQDWIVSSYYDDGDDAKKCSPTGTTSMIEEGNKENGTIQSSNNIPPTTTTKDTTTTANAKTIIDPKSGISYRFLKYTKKVQASDDTVVGEINNGESTAVTTTPNENNTVKNVEEMQYLHLCNDIIMNGAVRQDRTGIGTISKFGTQMKFSLRNNTFPLLTTKRTFIRGVIEELLWFIKGSTNANELAEKDIHIWDGNGSREFLDQRGLSHRDVGDLGPVYGFQWRHYGAKYVDMYTDYTGVGFDQLADCIHKIKYQPYDRRIIMTAWNPTDLNEMALPPCHMFCQFYVDTDKNEVSCQMYQRSADLGLGVPFNIASYALLTIMIAHVTGRKPGDFIHTIGDAHVYLNHIDALKEQIQREPREFPKLYITKDTDSIDDFEYADFNIVGYNPHKAIKMTMAV